VIYTLTAISPLETEMEFTWLVRVDAVAGVDQEEILCA
jgi:hypothetical protein